MIINKVDDAVNALILAREYAEQLGTNSVNGKTGMPSAFEDFDILREGFKEGVLNANIADELVRQNLM